MISHFDGGDYPDCWADNDFVLGFSAGGMGDGWERYPAVSGEAEGRGDDAREPNEGGIKGFSA
ncbi:MAG: hypothetical protein PQJ60_05800 [Spirochaetales bacterium]|nr:hypothetical protein [Spirochaetales bacterium]